MSRTSTEKEKQRLRVELTAEIAKNEQDLEQCNEETGWYNRKFLYNVRDLEQICSITKCPLTLPQLKKLDICRILPITERSWRMPYRAKYEWAKDRPQLDRAYHPWKLEKINDYSDDGKKKLLIRKVRALLNKITSMTEKSLIKEFLDYRVHQSAALKEVVTIIVDMASDDPKLCELFSRLCEHQVIAERSDNHDNSAFGEALLSRIDEMLDFDNEKEAKICQMRIRRSRRIGSVIFKGQLFLRGLGTFGYAEDTSFSHDEEPIECALRLFDLIGRRLQEVSQSAFPFDSLFADLRKVKPFVSNRIRCLIINLEEQRANGWITRKIAREEALREEKQRMRVELMTENAKIERDLEQCNEETGWYNREFLYNVRDLEQLFSITECPVTKLERRIFGICRSQPARLLPWKTLPFQPNLFVKLEHKPLHKAENPWKLEKIIDDSDDGKKELLIRNVRALLNKITPTNEESLTKEFLDYRVYQSSALEEIVSIIAELAMDEPKYCKLFSRVSSSQIIAERDHNPLRSSFRDALLSRVQAAFNFDVESITGEMKQIDSAESLLKLRSRKFGSVKFIGQLYLHGIVKAAIPLNLMRDMLDPLLRGTPFKLDEESIECALREIEVIGARLEADSMHASNAALPRFGPAFYKFLHRVKQLVGSRIRFIIIDLEEQRANGWKSLKAAEEEPVTFDQIKEEMEREYNEMRSRTQEVWFSGKNRGARETLFEFR